MDPGRSPFPGMDPYLEDPTRWQGFHDTLITYIKGDLQRVLPEPYYADIRDRVYLQEAGRWIVPDVRISESAREDRRATAPSAGGRSAAVVVEIPAVEVREPFIEIRDSRTGDRVVTVLEVLFPDNKERGTEGRRQYRAKQRQLLRSQTSLVEIDLLRGGEHMVAVPANLLEPYRPYHYLVVVRRADAEWSTTREVYPIRLADPLPEVKVPLRDPDPDVAVDLQRLFERAYEDGAYWKRIDYAAPPAPPLGDADQAWAREVLARRG